MSAPDDVRRLSDELARDPSSLVFLELGELLRHQGERSIALKVALRGLERHPHNAEAHDLLARLYVDDGELEKAFDEWDMVMRLSPQHVGARKGMGYVRFQQGRLDEAEVHLSEAATLDPADESNLSALAYVRQSKNGTGVAAEAAMEAVPAPAPEAASLPSRSPTHSHQETHFQSGGQAAHPSAVFHDLLAGHDQAAMLLDAEGLVLAGEYPVSDGRDIAQEVGAGLSGVSEEAGRAMRHLGLGAWTSIVFETDTATLAMAPGPDDGILLVAAGRSTPLGFVRRLLERASDRAIAWLGAEARP